MVNIALIRPRYIYIVFCVICLAFFCLALFYLPLTSRILTAVPVLIALVALALGVKSDYQIDAISDLHFDEKIAVMAKYKDMALQNQLENLTPVLYDFKAITYLFKYTTPEKKEELIKNNLIPTLNYVVNGLNELGEADEDTIYEIIQLAMKYNIEKDKLKKIEGYLHWPFISAEDRRKFHEESQKLEEKWRKKLQTGKDADK